jgi:hypothetical protein
MIRSNDGSVFQYCYEFGFREIDDEFIELKQNFDYPDYV